MSNTTETNETAETMNGGYVLDMCNLSSLEISNLGSDEAIPPCILYSLQPDITSSPNTTLVRIVQVTPSTCSSHRDGAPIAVQKMNEGDGIPIGFNRDSFIKFHLTSVIGGNNNQLTKEQYDTQHAIVLNQLLEEYHPHYIIGTCSFSADIEKAISQAHKTILLAQVGPPAFYENGKNPYLFGFHINSDTYPKSAAQALKFYADSLPGGQGVSQQPVRIIQRTASEFFRFTCQSAYDFSRELGFTDIQMISYDPDDDSNQNGIVDKDDTEFLQNIADQICPVNRTSDSFHPAIFACTLTEQDVLLQKWRSNGCRPTSIWMTPSTWNWANQNQDKVPFFFGGGQWHENFNYEDDYFSSGFELLGVLEPQLGYRGSYDLVVSYSIATLFSKHIQARYRIQNEPNLEGDLSTPEGHELFRRDLLVLKTNTLFGPFALDESQRNTGRGSAGTQWQSDANFLNETSDLANKCVSPLTQAESSNVLPAPVSFDCPAGSYISLDLFRNHSSLLTNKCDLCAPDTYTTTQNVLTTCIPCPDGATTSGEFGSTTCTFINDNILARSLVAMSLIMVCIVWSLSLSIFFWVYRRRSRDILKFSTMYLGFMCLGAGISSLSILAISFHAGSGSESNAASLGCQIAPFLYCIGWVMQAGALAALSRPIDENKYAWIKYATNYVEKEAMYPLVLAMLMDLIVLICWSVISPVEYGRRVLDTTVDLNTGMVTINSAGTCSGGSGVSVWMFITPLLVIHVLLLVQSFVLYYEYRNCDDRYKQRKHSFNATLFAFQILLTGFPLLVAVHDNATSRYLIMFGIIFANDLGVISIVFFPIRSARKSCTEYQENAKADAYESRRLKKERKKMLAELKNTERNQLSSVSGSAIESEDLSRLYRLNPNFQKEDVESPEAMESKSISQFDPVCSSTNRAISAGLPGDGFNNEVSSENQASTHISVETEGGKSSTLTSLSTSVGPKLKSGPGYYGFQY